MHIVQCIPDQTKASTVHDDKVSTEKQSANRPRITKTEKLTTRQRPHVRENIVHRLEIKEVHDFREDFATNLSRM